MLNQLLILVLSISLGLFLPSFVLAQTKAPPKQVQVETKAPEVKPQGEKQAQTKASEAAPKEGAKKEEIKAQEITTKKEESKCSCEKLVLDAINKAYVAIEEDEWATAIKVCTDAINTVKNLTNTCKCLDIPTYKNIAQAFLDYAKGGDILDGEKEPDCEVANKLYTETIKLLGETLPKIKDLKLKENAQNITDYSKEELEFVKDECSG